MLGAKSEGQIRLDLRLQTHGTEKRSVLFPRRERKNHLLDLVSRAGNIWRTKLGVRAVTSEEAAEVAIALPSKSETGGSTPKDGPGARLRCTQGARSLQNAIAVEPGYALSHAALATAWAQLGHDENARAGSEESL